ncbi:MAG TPA: peptidoglycan-binding protein [Candidatus Aminicenantes bacterium]|nr:peptidoglycan-binding protein [Candidatus Aminicenantes bacterium]
MPVQSSPAGTSSRLASSALPGLLALLLSCGRPIPPAPAPAVEPTMAVLETRVGPEGSDGPTFCRSDRLCGSEVLPAFYQGRQLRPAWIDEGLTLSDAKAFIDALRLVSADGLNPENYHLSTLESVLSEIRAARAETPGPVPPETLADLEMLLTDAFLLCGSHLVHGQVNPETIESEWFIKGRVEDLAAALEKGLETNDVPAALDSLRPAHAVYRGLMRAFDEYRALVRDGGWPAFPAGPKLSKGDRDPRVVSLREILTVMGDLPAADMSGDPMLFDEGLERALKAFQFRHGLEPDGVAGTGTASALAVTASDRLTQIRANLERWRWITQDLGERHIIVNVADYRVAVVESGREVLSMPAIVGSAYRRTPDFSGRMSYLEFSPSWTVPPKLAREDILPRVQSDPLYLRKKGIRVFEDWTDDAREIDPADIDWPRMGAEALNYKFRQDPGPQNSLGRVKFMFPNKFDVYLHDTPDRGLFRRAVRDLSSGCIRVEKPVELAEYLLRDDPSWTRERIVDAMGGRETEVVTFKEAVSVHIIYWTAWLGEDGRVHFRQDVYLRDAALYRALDELAAGPAG